MVVSADESPFRSTELGGRGYRQFVVIKNPAITRPNPTARFQLPIEFTGH